MDGDRKILSIKEKKEIFLEKFRKTGASILAGCKAAEITRPTYRKWLREDRSFANKIADYTEEALDFVEAQCFNLITQGDRRMIEFYLTHKGKSRGWGKEEVAEVGSLDELMGLSDEALAEIAQIGREDLDDVSMSIANPKSSDE